MTQFSELGLAAEILRAVEEQGYTEATPIQAQAIPAILEGRDVLAAAQTGTGKTGAFALPLLQQLSATAKPEQTSRPVRALILTPTRELAAQVNDSVRGYGKHVRIKTTMVCGGLSMRPQVEALRRGIDILVATPGRLMDHMQQRAVDLSKVEFLVLDEADRMLDMGFIADIRRIMTALPKTRQSLLFSATFSEEIRGLASSFLRNPTIIEVARRNADSELVSQRVLSVEQGRKRELLTKLIVEGDWQQALVFMRTKHGANRLAEQLEKSGIEADAIHGNKSQGARTRALSDFKRGAVRVLVATDIAARGIDIQELPHVVNYELPNVPEDYVHRIGRTGRAGSSGEAISLVAREEEGLMRDIERVLKRKMQREIVPGFERGSAPGEPIIVERSAGSRPARSAGSSADQQPRSHQPRGASGRPGQRPSRDSRSPSRDARSPSRDSRSPSRDARSPDARPPAHRRADSGARGIGNGFSSDSRRPRNPNSTREVDGNREVNGNRSFNGNRGFNGNSEVNGNRFDGNREVNGNRSFDGNREVDGNRRSTGGRGAYNAHAGLRSDKPAGARRGPGRPDFVNGNSRKEGNAAPASLLRSATTHEH